jgi:hypothetical protein
LNFIKIKNFCISSDTIKRVNRQNKGENTFANHVSTEELTSRLHKEPRLKPGAVTQACSVMTQEAETGGLQFKCSLAESLEDPISASDWVWSHTPVGEAQIGGLQSMLAQTNSQHRKGLGCGSSCRMLTWQCKALTTVLPPRKTPKNKKTTQQRKNRFLESHVIFRQ